MTVDVDGVVETDGDFIAQSYKGAYKKSGFVMARPSRKLCKQIKKRGISNKQTYIVTALDIYGNIVMERICLGRVSTDELEKLYKGHIRDDSIICKIIYSICKRPEFGPQTSS